jgi:hypothetical protein
MDYRVSPKINTLKKKKVASGIAGHYMVYRNVDKLISVESSSYELSYYFVVLNP